ncbi:MAG: crossover junction endodeoxyribonuclease RuvC [Patescibacteria group bacterium]|nr:crossover junction endodeoxyribonuclease RuvC [Patescibacteria group bacterium]
MIILGIDPGSTRIGYGVIDAGRELRLIAYGVIEISRKKVRSDNPFGTSGNDLAGLLRKASTELAQLIATYHPEKAGIEKLYFAKNVKTGIEVAQARGVLIGELARHNLPIEEFTPSEIKSAVTGYGNADKKSVAKMVAKLLRIESVKGYDDASDALAVAITTSQKRVWG